MKIRIILLVALSLSAPMFCMQSVNLSMLSRASVLARSSVGVAAGGVASLIAVKKLGIDPNQVPDVVLASGVAVPPSLLAVLAGRSSYTKAPEHKLNEAIRLLNSGDPELIKIAMENDKPEQFFKDVDDYNIVHSHPRVEAFEGLKTALENTRKAEGSIGKLNTRGWLRPGLTRRKRNVLKELEEREANIKRAISILKEDPTWQKRVGSHSKRRAAQKVEEAAEHAKDASRHSQSAARDAKISAAASSLSMLKSWFGRK